MPSFSALVESQISAIGLDLSAPIASNRATSVGSPPTGFGSSFQSPVWTTRPTGVVISSAQLSGIECATLIASMVNGPTMKGLPTRIGDTMTLSTISSEARFAASIAAVNAVA